MTPRERDAYLRAVLRTPGDIRLDHGGVTIFGHITATPNAEGAFAIRPWGCAADLQLHLDTVRLVSIVSGLTWAETRAIQANQRAGIFKKHKARPTRKAE